MDDLFNTTIECIIALIKEAGYDPYAQLNGYLVTGEENYITRRGGARSIVSTLNNEQICRYLEEHLAQIK